ncbi:hypothetical protein Gasu2_13940 [Galdieria sulphuraria]|uniref:Plastid lipid-associated protein/fibrillin conserved domain-containing protein n=1 Tax=Galdieria sulphuraria TaxID=130081 RepID=M2XSU5_GALSU|nr:uncharacterized protein Gasu_56360 [Galdieria sulphuraria]EME26738.1 hypothetical protein Gasu_56360 [Galdieria sulphuraria]GJD07010.1 hypothetical protein Gasu2_13940 [Galdieria sulphuraria]|eukprot:XP_005703258.1 hypothetical protein Gasu_56360 [Galdieria sulphuraria]
MLFVVCWFLAANNRGLVHCCRRVQKQQGKPSFATISRPSKSLFLRTYYSTKLSRCDRARIAVDATFEKQSNEVTQIKRHLRKMLTYLINMSPQRRRIFALIRGLEGRYSPPSSVESLVQQLQGDWKLVFSSTTLGIPSRELVVLSVTQTLGVGKLRENGCFEIIMVNKCRWNYVQQGAHGLLEIFCVLTFLGRCRFMCRVSDYRMETHDQVKATEARSIVAYLQRNLPREFFDPNNCMLQVSFVDNELRIVKWLGKRFAGVRNIFYRCDDKEIS